MTDGDLSAQVETVTQNQWRHPRNLFFYFVVFANIASLIISVLLTWSNFSRWKEMLK